MDERCLPGLKQSKKCPLEEQKIEKVNSNTGLTEEFSSLDVVWMEEINFLPYVPPPSPHKELEASPGKVNLEPLWVESIEMLNEDLQLLLQFNHHKFWCQVMHDRSLLKSLDSYLHFSPRSFDHAANLPLHIQELLRNIHKRVFMVFLRMSTHKESQNDFISLKKFGDIIYEHFLFDIPKLMDLCVIYGESNQPLLTKMVLNIFEKQPKYIDDWKITVKIILETFTEMLRKILGDGMEREAVRLDRPVRLTPSEFSEIVIYLGDFIKTLCCFVTVHTQACYDLEAAGCIEKAIHFYESTITKLQENWHALRSELLDPMYIKVRFRSFKKDVAWLVHELLQVCFISPQPADSSGIKRKGSLDGFISIVSDIVSEKCFLKEYKKHFDLAKDVWMVQSAHPEIPETHFDYILSALMDDPVPPDQAFSISGTATSSSSNPPEEAILVSQVKDLLPHLGEGFIQVCLREFGNNPETVINRILEDNLPPHLKNLDFSQPTTDHNPPPPKVDVSQKPMESLVDQRESVFDNDEFDVFRNPGKVDLSRVHIGKKFDSTSTASLLDDKSHLEDTRQRYKAYEIETPWDYMSEDQAGEIQALGGDEESLTLARTHPDILRDFPFDMCYDDEYDDTYDSHNIGAPDDATDEQFAVKRLNQKIHSTFRPNQKVSSGGQLDGDSDEEKKTVVSSHHAFSIKGKEKITRKDGRKDRGTVNEKKSRHSAEGKAIKDGARLCRDNPRTNEATLSDKTWRSNSRSLKEGSGWYSKEGKFTQESNGIRSLQEPLKQDPHHPSESADIDAKHYRAKGRGQPAQATGNSKQSESRDRQIKDRHKSSQANHSRKAMADKKRRGGMI